MWYQKIIQIFKIKDLRNKILFVLGILIVFRMMANIPIPGINLENLKGFFAQFQMFGLLNMFTGGALEGLSIAMLGLGPFITAIIIVQLLTLVFPQLEHLYKEEGEQGRAKINQYSRILTVPLAFLQGFGMLKLLEQQKVIGSLPPLLFFSSILTVTAGSVFLMWLGELISEKGIGNGISILILAGIISGLPMEIYQMLVQWDPSITINYILFFVMALVIIIGVVFINEGRRNIPVSYAKRVRGQKMYGGVSTYLPLNINPAGVIPIIFALSILLLPGMIANFLSGSGGQIGQIAQSVGDFFENPWVHGILLFVLIVVFTYFYTAVTFDPKAIASNLQKMGGFIPGIRPGENTSNFINQILNRVLLVGAIFLGVIALMPSIIGGITGVYNFQFLIGGTSLLIIVSVILETWRQVKAQLGMREYETF